MCCSVLDLNSCQSHFSVFLISQHNFPLNWSQRFFYFSRLNKARRKLLDKTTGTRVNRKEKLLVLQAKMMTFRSSPASVSFLVENTINYFSSEGLCYKLLLTMRYMYLP